MRNIITNLISIIKIRLDISNNSNMIEIALFLSVIFTLVIFVMLGHNISHYYYFGLSVTFLLYLIYHKVKGINKINRFNWGEEKKYERKFDLISSYFIYSKKNHEIKKTNNIDDQTWSDLNMNDIYEKIDRTITTPGENILYDFLRTPLLNIEELKKRDKIIELFNEDEVLRKKILAELLKLDKDKSGSITDLVFGTLPEQTKYRYLFTFLYLIGLASAATIPFLLEKSLLLLIPVFIFNTFVALYHKNYYSHLVPSIRYLNRLLKSASILREVISGTEELLHFNNNLKENLKKSKKLIKKSKFTVLQIKSEYAAMFDEYFNFLFLNELRSFYSSLEEIKKNIVSVREIYKIIGELDSYQSIASYKVGLERYCKPNFLEKKNNSINMVYIEATEIVHPLVENSVSNTFIFSKKNGIIITGSNMAGKSTFLRTVGVNVILSQTIYISFAKKYDAIPMKIISSISQVDDINKGKSFYFTESERLLKIINSTVNDEDIITLCLIDELLKGTNSFERLNASEEILKYILEQNSLSIIATHDIDLANNLKNKFECYHFVDNVDSKKGLDFDYKMKKGISKSSNAIRLLEYLQYPQVIYENAYRKGI